MDSYEVYGVYLALKLHFTTDYDFHRYNGKVKASVVNQLDKKGFRYDVQRLSKHKDPFNFILANMLVDPDTHPVKWRDEACEKIYRAWLGRTNRLSYLFSEEIKKLDPDFDQNFRFSETDHPPLLALFLEGEISIETLTILLDLTEAFPYWLKKLRKGQSPFELLVWRGLKYRPFLSYDKSKIRDRVLDRWKTYA